MNLYPIRFMIHGIHFYTAQLDWRDSNKPQISRTLQVRPTAMDHYRHFGLYHIHSYC